MSEKEKINALEVEQVSGGASALGESFHGLHRSGPYKCPFCGEEYYLGDAEISVGMCQNCWHDPDRLSKRIRKQGVDMPEEEKIND